MNYTFRALTQADEPVIWQMLMHAAHELSLEAVKSQPILARYAVDWGRPGDDGFVAGQRNHFVAYIVTGIVSGVDGGLLGFDGGLLHFRGGFVELRLGLIVSGLAGFFDVKNGGLHRMFAIFRSVYCL